MTATVWTEERMKVAAKMWRAGATVPQMATALNVSRRSISRLTDRNRGLFPHRQMKVIHAPKLPAADQSQAIGVKVNEAYRVKRPVSSGAVITMPRITMIDGPAP